MRQALWLVTGVSSGLGLALAERLLHRGNRVVGTVRTAQDASAFEALAPGLAQARLLDVTCFDRIPGLIAEIERDIGAIDVLVNNAGYGLVGAVEETSDAELEHIMATNFYGPAALMRALLPFLRARGAGTLVNVSSIGGHIGMAALAANSASKFALEGLSESMAGDLAPLGIRMMLVAPGPFRTHFSTGMRDVEQRIPAYASVTDALRQSAARAHGHQPGDPHRAADLIIDAVNSGAPPLHLVLSEFAMAALRGKLAAMQDDLGRWRQASLDTALR